MNIEQFENEFPEFYIELGYCASGQLPDSINVLNLKAIDKVTQLDDKSCRNPPPRPQVAICGFELA